VSPSDAFITFYTLLLGLGVAALLTGFAAVLRGKQLRHVSVAGMLLCILIVFEFLSAWAGALRTFRNVDVNIASLALPFGTGSCYFMASVRMFPEPASDGETIDVGAYIARQIRTIAFFLFAANLMLVAAEFPYERARFATDPGHILRFYVPYNAAILACYGLMMTLRSRRIATAAMVTLVLIYTWVTVARLI
jgi:hypothetical protein